MCIIKFPKPLKKINHFLAIVSGSLCLLIAFFATYEVIMRYVFNNPTSWTADWSTYLHLWAMFCTCGYTYQVNGHVGVDAVRDIVDKHDKSKNRIARRVMAILSYIMTLIFLVVIFAGTIKMTGKVIEYHTMTVATHPIYALWLYAGMLIGCGLMIISVIFIILDLFTDSNDYL